MYGRLADGKLNKANDIESAVLWHVQCASDTVC